MTDDNPYLLLFNCQTDWQIRLCYPWAWGACHSTNSEPTKQCYHTILTDNFCSLTVGIRTSSVVYLLWQAVLHIWRRDVLIWCGPVLVKLCKVRVSTQYILHEWKNKHLRLYTIDAGGVFLKSGFSILN